MYQNYQLQSLCTQLVMTQSPGKYDSLQFQMVAMETFTSSNVMTFWIEHILYWFDYNIIKLFLFKGTTKNDSQSYDSVIYYYGVHWCAPT